MNTTSFGPTAQYTGSPVIATRRFNTLSGNHSWLPLRNVLLSNQEYGNPVSSTTTSISCLTSSIPIPPPSRSRL